MNSKMKVALTSLLIAIIIGVTYGAIKYTTPIDNHVTIQGYGISLWRADSGVEVTSINWGTVAIDSSIDSDTALGLPTATHKLAIKNTGDYVAYCAWIVDPSTPLPAGLSLSGWHSNMETEPYQNTWDANIFTFSVSPGAVSTWRVRWVLNVGVNAIKGDFNFNILLLAADSATG